MVYPPILYVNVAVGNFEEVDNVNKAKKALGGAGLSYTEGTLEQFELANKPGALAELAGRLAKKGINIDCAYATMPKGATKLMMARDYYAGEAWGRVPNKQ